MKLTSDQIREAIERARIDPTLLASARLMHGCDTTVLSRNHDRTRGVLRISDAGACTRELWAKDRGLLDIPEDPKSSLRMDNGTLVGSWLACLLMVGLEAQDRKFRVELELDVEHENSPGHIDAAVYYESAPVATIELKWSGWPGKTDLEAKPAHRIQSGKYALAIGAPQHFVVTYFAAAWAKGDYLVVHPFDTEETEFDVAVEYARLREALLETIPDPNPPEDYLCKSCRYSNCERNQNPLAGMVIHG